MIDIPSSGRCSGQRRSILAYALLLGLLLNWPLLLYGRPAYIADSAAYYKGGRVAVSVLISKFTLPTKATGRADPALEQRLSPQEGQKAAAQARGVRSITYSVFAYILGAPRAQMLILAFTQALLAGLTCSYFLHVLPLKGNKAKLSVAAVLAFGTPLAFVAALAVPDIFAGLLVISIILPAVAMDRLTIASRLLLAGMGAFAVSAHASHPPLAAGLLFVVAILLVRSWRQRGLSTLKAFGWAAAPLIIGVLGTVAINRVGFGEASLVAKRFPLTLARSIADGPARWYLEEHCATQHFAVCEVYPKEFPTTVTGFLWGPNGVSERASPEQLDRIRAEEPTIVLAAALEFPAQEAFRFLKNLSRQLVQVRPEPSFFDERMEIDAAGTPSLTAAPQGKNPVATLIEILSLVTALAALLWMAVKIRLLSPADRAAVWLVLSALVINAAICVYFSGIANRYGARVIWLLPLFAFGLLGRAQQTDALPEPAKAAD